jgi:hypothetical protein
MARQRNHRNAPKTNVTRSGNSCDEGRADLDRIIVAGSAITLSRPVSSADRFTRTANALRTARTTTARL